MDARVTYTPNLKLARLPANFHVWAQIMNDNLTMVDAAVSGFIVFKNLRGSWTNSTAYALGDTVVDPDTAVIWQAQVAHTSSSIPAAFLDDRTANPTYWTVYSSAATGRGHWTGPGTVYAVNDFVVNGLQYAICIISHTSTNNFTHDVASGFWSILIDLTSIGTALLPTPGGALDANKFAMVDQFGASYGIFDKDYALSVMGATTIGVALLRAISQATARSAIDAAQSTDTTTQSPGDASTKYASTQFVQSALLATQPAANVVRTTVFNTPGTTTWTPNINMVYAKAQGWGAGGAGGSTVTGPATLYIGGGGGAAGSWAKKFITKAAAGASQTVIIGAAAAQPAAGNTAGGVGGDTSLGALLVAKGGSGGAGQPASGLGGAGGLGVAAGNVGDETGPGMSGANGSNLNSQIGTTNSGGSAVPIGSGGRSNGGNLTTFQNGEAAIGFASGGGGGGSYNAGGTSRGGVGTGGYLVIEEYCTA